MWKKIYKRLYWYFRIGIKYSFHNVVIKGDANSVIHISPSVRLRNVNIYMSGKSSLVILDNVNIANVNIHIEGEAYIGKGTNIYGDDNRRNFIVLNGSFKCGDNNRLQSNIRIRFGGVFNIGSYNNINGDSEIRCDESITIGDFNQISYNVMIWDTNTHNIYSAERRREITKKEGIGHEYEKPKTAKVVIGSDCWIGKGASILKGVTLSDRCVVGFHTLLTDTLIPANTTVVTQISYKMFENNI